MNEEDKSPKKPSVVKSHLLLPLSLFLRLLQE